MAGGRDPWRGADDPYRQQRYPGSAAERAPRGDRSPPRGAEASPPEPSAPGGGFDSRSVFIGPAEQDPRPGPRSGGGNGRSGGGGAHAAPPPPDGARGRRAARPDRPDRQAPPLDPGRQGQSYDGFGRGPDRGYGADRSDRGGPRGRRAAGPGAAAGGAGLGAADRGLSAAGGTAVATPPGQSSVFDGPPADPHDPFAPRPGLEPGGPGDWDDEGDEGDEGPRGPRTWRQRVILGAGVFLVVVCMAGTLGAMWVLKTYNSIDRVEGLELNQVAAGEPRNYLVVGSDSRGGENSGFGDTTGQRSDTIMVMRVDPATGGAFALSFPRDLQVEIAGTGGTNKINSAYADGDEGVQRLISTLQENFAIPIHHYVEIDFAGFKGLIDHIGGVPLYFDMAVRNPPGEHDVGLNITELGCVNVGSEQALALARSRSLQYRAPDGWVNDPYGDYGRMTRQQIVIKQALRKAVQQARSNPVQLSGMAELAAGTVTLDASLGINDLLDLADQFSDFDPNSLQTYSLPIYTEDDEGKGDPYPDLVKAEPILNAFRGLPIDEVGPPLVQLTVVNGSGQEGQAANVAGAFQKIGFDVQEPTSSDAPVAQTTVFHAPGEDAYGKRVARHLTAPALIQPQEGLGPGEVELVTGPDFDGVWEQPLPIDQLPAAPAAPASPPAGESPGSTTATTAAAPPASGSEPATPAPPPPPTEQVGHTAGQPPEGTSCG